MKQGGHDFCLRWIVTLALLSTGVCASARAGQVEVSNPAIRYVAEDADTIDILFDVINTGVPDKVAVDIGSITEVVTPAGRDTQNDVLSDGSIIETTCGTLGVKKGCDVLARYDVLDADPFDKQPADIGVWYAGISVSWTIGEGMHSGSGFGQGVVIVYDRGVSTFTIPEPSTWAGLLVGFSVLGFAGYYRARPRQL